MESPLNEQCMDGYRWVGGWMEQCYNTNTVVQQYTLMDNKYSTLNLNCQIQVSKSKLSDKSSKHLGL